MPSGLSTASRAECRALAAAFSMYPRFVQLDSGLALDSLSEVYIHYGVSKD